MDVRSLETLKRLEMLTEDDFAIWFSDRILERGYNYFGEERVAEPIIVEGVIKAKVCGTATYDVAIDMEKQYFRCTCPYFVDCGNCKHLAALFYRLADDPQIVSVDATVSELESLSKEGLIRILKDVLIIDPDFRGLLADEKDTRQAILSLYDSVINTDMNEFLDRVAILRRQALSFEAEKAASLLKVLFVELYRIYEDFGGDEVLEDEIYDVVEALSSKLDYVSEDCRQDLMDDVRRIYRSDDSHLKDFAFDPVKEHL